jgi:hypothetical protein
MQTRLGADWDASSHQPPIAVLFDEGSLIPLTPLQAFVAVIAPINIGITSTRN